DTRLGARLMRMLDDFARLSDEPDRLTRLYLSPAHKRACDQLITLMHQAGMTVRSDPLATVIGRYEGSTSGAPALLIGSHIDTVRNAGRYDGTLGVLAAVVAIEELNRTGERRPFAVEVVAFGDEEGVRFPVTLCGSKALAGTIDPGVLHAIDSDGITLREALVAFGCDPGSIENARQVPEAVLAFVEAHIEQGPVLEAAGQPLGVVTAINGAKRFRVGVTGVAGHAGTVPMQLRRDSLTAAAEMVLAVEELVKASGQAVATVGSLEVEPGAINVIAGTTIFSVDLRSPSNNVCDTLARDLASAFKAIAGRRGVQVTFEETHAMRSVACSEHVIGELERAIEMTRSKPMKLPSGAGHDAMAMASLCDTGMLFVRCRDGLSHHPDEAISEQDAHACVEALLNFIRIFEPITTRQPYSSCQPKTGTA
ncbi:MAG: allantoate amidohydrolase, partial [Hyphomicrobiaceae bacterium]